MKRFRPLTALLCSVLLVACLTVPASANSAQTSWRGVSSTGMVCQDAESPIEVKSELLTFDFPSGPSPYADSAEDFNNYTSSFTAEYTFFNPSDYTVTARLFFPIGTWPEYFPQLKTQADGSVYDDLDKFNVTVDGQPIEKEIRHSLDSYSFSLDRHLLQLQDGYREDVFFDPQMPVTHYVFRYSGLDESDLWNTGIGFVVHPMEDACLYFAEQNSLWVEDDGALRPECDILDRKGTLNLYAIGKPLEQLPSWEVMDGERKPIPAKIELQSTQTTTLEQEALRGWTEASGISKTDWYNAMVERLINVREAGETPGLISTDAWSEMPMENLLMTWYSYEITLEPGQELVNTVTAPMFTDIDESGYAASYDYTYLLSPAKTWSSFGPLDIRIQTPYRLAESSLDGWTQDEEGYSLHLDGLPDQELSFTLSEGSGAVYEPDVPSGTVPEPGYGPDLEEEPGFASALLVPAVLVLLVIVVIVIVVRMRRKKK